MNLCISGKQNWLDISSLHNAQKDLCFQLILGLYKIIKLSMTVKIDSYQISSSWQKQPEYRQKGQPEGYC